MIIPYVTCEMVMREFGYTREVAQAFIDIGISKGWVIPCGKNLYRVTSQKIIDKAQTIVDYQRETHEGT